MGDVWLANGCAIGCAFDGMLLHHDPLVAALAEGFNEGVGVLGMIGQGHFGWREPAHARERFEAKEGSEMVLPGADVAAEIERWGGGGDGVAPCGAEEFDTWLTGGIGGEMLERIEYVACAHLTQAVEETAGIIEHDARLSTFVQKLRNERAHALVAPAEHRGIVSIRNLRVLKHVAEVADDWGGGEIARPGGDQRLMHVESDGEAGGGVGEVDGRTRNRRGIRGRGSDKGLGAADIREIVDGFEEGVGHGLGVKWLIGGQGCIGNAGPQQCIALQLTQNAVFQWFYRQGTRLGGNKVQCFVARWFARPFYLK